MKGFWINVTAGFFTLVLIWLIKKFIFNGHLVTDQKQIENKKEEKKETVLQTSLKKMTKQEFIDFLSPSMKAISQKTGIPYKFMMAQMALETGWGKSELFYKHFNVGGIRSFKPETEQHAMYWTWEHVAKSDLPKWDKYERDKAKDYPIVKDGKPTGKIAIRVKLPFMSYPTIEAGLLSYLNRVLLNKWFKGYIAEAKGDADKYVELLQSGKSGAKYATAVNYVPTIKGMMKNFA